MPMFKDHLQEANSVCLDPFSCTPLKKIREKSRSGVHRIISLDDTSTPQASNGYETGLAGGSDTAINIPRVDTLLQFV